MRTKEKGSDLRSPLHQLDFYTVAAGASAGGLEAFTAFVKSLNPKSGAAYVILQHLDPSHESLLPDLLSNWTTIPVVPITDDIKVKPDHVYVHPGNKLLSIKDGKLKLESLDPDGHGGAVLIDHFFSALAQDQAKQAIGILFSGTGTDGTKGLQAIKEHGGISIVQDEVSAKWPDMPRNAVKAGVVDHILSPDRMSDKILELINNEMAADEKTDAAINSNEERKFIDAILDQLHKYKGKDFGQYKKTTIGRRISRRMTINTIGDLKEYNSFLQQNTKEQDALYNDILISVTEFFRDRESYTYISKEILPQIISRKKEGDVIRVWVAGCSTGEEAYSLAICLSELLDAKAESNLNVQILATDLSQPSLSKARQALYSEKDIAGLSKERLERFFEKKSNGYQIKKAIRELCLFPEHNFLTDPPFGNLDLISCRNVMIYMEPVIKKRGLTNFHYGLRPDGWLWLGKSEANTASRELFSPSDKTHRVFKRQDVPAKIIIEKTMTEIDGVQNIHRRTVGTTTDLQKLTDSIILKNYSPTGVVVNDQFEIVNYRGNTQRYLMQKSGTPSHNLLKLAKVGLAVKLRSIIELARKEKRRITKEEVLLKLDDHLTSVDIEAMPLEDAGGDYVLVLFKERPKGYLKNVENSESNGTSDSRDRRIAQLELELVQTREDMRTIVENQEVANEELQSANEELMSSSEELQTLNEELETSKEELQSANEEITVANQELQEINEVVAHERNYAEAIVKTLREPLLILDSDLRIKSANRSFFKNFRVHEQETVGQLVYKLGNNQWDIPELRKLLEEIIPDKHTIYDYEVTHNFESIGKRTMLLNAVQINNEEEDKKLILLSVDDITERKRVRDELENSIQRYNELINSSIFMIAVLEGPDMIVRSANKAFIERFYRGTIVGQSIFKMVPELKDLGLDSTLREVYKTGQHHSSYEVPIMFLRDGQMDTAYYNFVYQPQKDKNGKIIGVAIIANEITPQAELNLRIKESVHEFEEFIYSSPFHIAILKGEDLKVDIANDAILKTWGKTRSVIGMPFLDAVPSLKNQGFYELLLNVFHTGEAHQGFEVPATLERNGRHYTEYFDFVFQPQRNKEGKIVGVAIIGTEVTPQAKFHSQLRESEEKFRNMADLTPDKITLTDKFGQAIYCNHSWLEYLNTNATEFYTLKALDLAHPNDVDKAKIAISECFGKGKDVEIEARIKNAAGEYKWHLVRARPIMDGLGEIIYWITATTMIHKIKQEEKRKEDFLKMVSHELKTPVTSIKGYTQLLLSMLKQKKASELDGIPLVPSLERINNQISRLTRLITEMLDLSRVEESKLGLKKEIFSMNELVEHNVQDIKYSSKESQIKIIHKDHFRVNGDKDRLGQVLINFITNAIKYSPDDKNIEVSIFKNEAGQGAVAVKDRGIGIADKDFANIFKRFYRVSGKNEETYSGFGIGLFLAEEIVTRHGGTITVNSTLGEGSEFIFTLPTID